MKLRKPKTLVIKECGYAQDVIMSPIGIYFYSYRPLRQSNAENEQVWSIYKTKNARKLAKWLIQYADWREAEERE